MSASKSLRPTFDRYGRRDHVQAITLTGGLHGTDILPYGITSIVAGTTGAGNTVTLGRPTRGVRKTILLSGVGNSSVPHTIQTHSSAVTFFGTSGNTLVMSTALADGHLAIGLCGLSTAQWGLETNLVSGLTVAAATQTV